MTAHAALIAAKLQGAHERRQRGEDKDMGKDEGVWAEAARQIEQALTMVRENVERGLPDEDVPQSNAVTAERVVELERQLAEQTKQATIAKDQVDEAWTRQSELERQLVEARERIEELEREQRELFVNTAGITLQRDEAHDLLATAYVAREVPWTDVAAGMMTIARDGTPWMVESRGYDADNEFVILRNGEKTFEKTLADPGETVRVLVPYVTPEQAEELVKSELGGRA